MAGEWVVAKADDSVESIAYRHGHDPDTLWNHPENQKLRELRSSMHVLLEGDRIYVPALRPKQLPRPTGARHSFRRRAVPSLLRLRLVLFGRPVSRCPCRVEFPDHDPLQLETDEDGHIEIPLWPDADPGRLVADLENGTALEFPLRPRKLDPVTTMSGVQARLSNLGLYRGEIDGLLNEGTLFALMRFQELQGLPRSGASDDATRAALLREHGS